MTYTSRILALFTLGGLLLPLAPGLASGEGYRKPPESIRKVLDAPPPPLVSISPKRDQMVLIDWVRYPPLADLAQPMLRLAGLRINPNTNGPHEPRQFVGFRIKTIPSGQERRIALPAGADLGAPVWTPDGKRFAFTLTRPNGIQLWLADAVAGTARQLPNIQLNAAYGTPVQWMPGGKTLLVQTVASGRGKVPAAPTVPPGPTIQESAGRAAPVRTYQDLLKNPHDEALFDHYATSQLTLVEASGGKAVPVGKPGIFADVEPSPDGKYLLVARNHRPYSYLIGYWAFPKKVEVWDRTGRPAHKLADLPLAERVPIGGVPTGPRGYHWMPTDPATLVWVEALDEGDPKKKVAHRDRVRLLPAPFRTDPTDLAKTEHRYAGLHWIERGGQVLLSEYDRDRLWRRTWLIDRANLDRRLVWDLSVNDRYKAPGEPVYRTLANGHRAVRREGNSIYLEGPGASPEGDRPFLDRLNLESLQAERLFHSPAGSYESFVALIDADRFITRRETLTEPPNYLLRSLGEAKPTALTRFPDPAPQLRSIQKRLVTYKRADGVPLSFTLYLPPDYKEGERLPTFVWAYPREYGDAATAGQVSGSPHRFTTITGISHLFLVLEGYAVLDNATMPVVGPPETVNDTFIEQIVGSAKAAIDKAVELGVTDPERVAVGGHSYGAFMTANLLAHSDLFRTGIARSGAYNRTLTPFGFQSERRTVWEAPEVYTRLSPFMHAHKINEPLLLIHGEADDNPGTFPMQSERMYHAVKGNGGTVRYVELPHESHGYVARESVAHTLWEMASWCDRFLKQGSANQTKR